MSARTPISNSGTSPAPALETTRRRTRDGRTTQVEQLAEFVSRSRWEDISELAGEQLKLRVLDSLGCALGALEGEPVQILRQQDEWARDLAPSDELRKWFDHRPERFDQFRARYREELAGHADQIEALRDRASTGPLTILYAARDRERNNAVVLAELLPDG